MPSYRKSSYLKWLLDPIYAGITYSFVVKRTNKGPLSPNQIYSTMKKNCMLGRSVWWWIDYCMRTIPLPTQYIHLASIHDMLL